MVDLWNVQQDKEDTLMPFEEAIRLIQVHERARQGRLRAKFMREIRQQEAREKQLSIQGVPTLDLDIAAMRIQKVLAAVIIKHTWTWYTAIKT